MMTLALLLLASGAFAQNAVPSLQGPQPSALEQLETAAQSPAKADASMDGSQARKTSKDGTVVEETRRETYVRHVPAVRDCDYSDVGGIEGRMRPYRNCVNTPARREQVVRDVETVRIEDREKYNARGARNGALIGGAVGLLGFLALFAGPIGLLVGLGAVAVGAGVGAAIGYASAKSTPDRFERSHERSATPVL